jgi:adenosylmethionine-8-amino-7-oxononanoate aminotransferase
MASSVFQRGSNLRTAVRAEGCWIVDSDGNRYLDAAGGAVVCGVGHGRREVATAIARQLETVDYVHATTFQTHVVEDYARAIAERAPIEEARVYPVSGGSEAMETALKLARAYHLVRGEPQRIGLLARQGSYHGNSLGALDLSGRTALRTPYLPWLGRTVHLPPVYEYRCPAPDHPLGCGEWHALRLEEEIVTRGNVAAFVAESVGGATLGAAVPPDDYWPAIVDVCRRHGVLLITDEVMAGFGRTGTWFGIEHWKVRPDIIVAGKGASSGYWPLGLVIASKEVHDAVGGAFVHGFTYSHHPAGAAAGKAVIEILETEGLLGASARQGERLLGGLREAIGQHPLVGDIRGLGLLVAVEFVSDRATKTPFDRAEAVTERLLEACLENGLIVYPASKGADGMIGDAVLFGPPLTISNSEIDTLIDRFKDAVTRVSRQ